MYRNFFLSLSLFVSGFLSAQLYSFEHNVSFESQAALDCYYEAGATLAAHLFLASCALSPIIGTIMLFDYEAYCDRYKAKDDDDEKRVEKKAFYHHVKDGILTGAVLLFIVGVAHLGNCCSPAGVMHAR